MLRSIRSVLAVPLAYELWWKLVGGPAWAKALISNYIQPEAGARILEIGCGPGTILKYLPQTEYLGFDLSSKYIELAKKRFPDAKFICDRVSHFSVAKLDSFDLVLALGVVHHLEDTEATRLFQIAYDALKPDGKLVTVDGAWTHDQSPAARWLLARDRGEFIRGETGYLGIASEVFKKVKSTIRHDLLRVPYTHMIMECVR